MALPRYSGTVENCIAEVKEYVSSDIQLALTAYYADPSEQNKVIVDRLFRESEIRCRYWQESLSNNENANTSRDYIIIVISLQQLHSTWTFYQQARPIPPVDARAVSVINNTKDRSELENELKELAAGDNQALAEINALLCPLSGQLISDPVKVGLYSEDGIERKLVGWQYFERTWLEQAVQGGGRKNPINRKAFRSNEPLDADDYELLLQALAERLRSKLVVNDEAQKKSKRPLPSNIPSQKDEVFHENDGEKRINDIAGAVACGAGGSGYRGAHESIDRLNTLIDRYAKECSVNNSVQARTPASELINQLKKLRDELNADIQWQQLQDKSKEKIDRSKAVRIARLTNNMLSGLIKSKDNPDRSACVENYYKKVNDSALGKFAKVVGAVIIAATVYAACVGIGLGIGIATGAFSGPGAFITGLMGATSGAAVGIVAASAVFGGISGFGSGIGMFKPSKKVQQARVVANSARRVVLT